MKSDREFIDGIYEKAAKLAEEAPAGEYDRTGLREGGKPARFPKIAAACAAVLVLCIGVAAFGLLRSSDNTGENPGKEPGSAVTRMMPSEGTDVGSPAAAQFSLDLPEEDDQNFALTGSTLEGSVSEVSETGGADLTVQISGAVWLSNAPGDEPESVAVHYTETDGYGRIVAFQTGEKVLLFLNAKEEEGTLIYYLANGAESKYAFWKEEDGRVFYKNSDGTVLERSTVEQE